ncbi:MAG: transposase domain-containing protein, partial [Anderseniella sp.]|nr:transposase domain-containing protein [Anderseniella sp.]
ATLITTAKLNSVEPEAWLSDILTRLSDGYPMNRIDDLLPWNWKPA